MTTGRDLVGMKVPGTVAEPSCFGWQKSSGASPVGWCSLREEWVAIERPRRINGSHHDGL